MLNPSTMLFEDASGNPVVASATNPMPVTGSALNGSLNARSLPVTSGAVATTLYAADFGSDLLTSVRVQIIRTGGTAPAIPLLGYVIARTAALGAPAVGDFGNESPDNGTINEERLPIIPDEGANSSVIIRPTEKFQYCTVKFDTAPGANYRIFITGAA